MLARVCWPNRLVLHVATIRVLSKVKFMTNKDKQQCISNTFLLYFSVFELSVSVWIPNPVISLSFTSWTSQLIKFKFLELSGWIKIAFEIQESKVLSILNVNWPNLCLNHFKISDVKHAKNVVYFNFGIQR